jgi:hypothetical protein
VSIKTPRNWVLGNSFDSREGGESNGVLRNPTFAAVVESVAGYWAMSCTRTKRGDPKSHHNRELESSKDALVLELSSRVLRIFLAQKTSV